MKQDIIPDEALAQHIAILGKTGSGKTSTEKLAVEQVVADGFRVCVLDAIKSDWWGITSSAGGKKPGLPFRILGGPHGHVPLHSSAGAVIGQLVGSGKLPLSIIDMADFEPGGLQRFFVDFAPALMRSMRGVLYLVVEEAHEFAPKERSGFGAENMAIHWAKKLATAGRSKGIRMIVATQRVQSLHNAVLGSCETLIAHRLSAPADQEPILKWLKANADKETTDNVARSLSSLPTGTGWLCSGEARIFKQVAFPKFKTYDNAATPMQDGPDVQVKTAPVDQDELRTIIGDAVAEAEASDPKRLRARIAELEKAGGAKIDAEALRKAENAAETRGRAHGYKEALSALRGGCARLREAAKMLGEIADGIPEGVDRIEKPAPGRLVPREGVSRKPAALSTAPPAEGITGPQQRILDAMALLQALGLDSLHKVQIAAIAGVSPSSGSFANNLGRLRTLGLIDYPQSGQVAFTAAGRKAARAPAAPPSIDDLHRAWLGLVTGPQARILERAIGAYPEAISKEDLARAVDVSASSGSYANNLGRLRTLGVIDYPTRGMVRANDLLFPVGRAA